MLSDIVLLCTCYSIAIFKCLAYCPAYDGWKILQMPSGYSPSKNERSCAESPPFPLVARVEGTAGGEVASLRIGGVPNLEPKDEAGGGDTKVDLGGGGNLNWDIPILEVAEGVAAGEGLNLSLSDCVFPSFVGVKSPRRSN
jgi:hypothetical protein